MMSLPFSIRHQIAEALDWIASEPNHSLLPAQRKRLYALVAAHDPVFSTTWRGWLAIQAAQYELPLFYRGHFTDDAMPERVYALPRKSVELAIKIQQHASIQESLIQSTTDQGYEAFGILLQEASDDPESFPINAVWAGKTAANALLEVAG